MQVYKPGSPDRFSYPRNISVFLAGSIEMGKAEDWQKIVIDRILQYEALLNQNGDSTDHFHVFNPRRTDWNSSWKQQQTNPRFNEQVNWELNHLEQADIVFFYFDPESKSPISLLELGLFARSGKLIVCCPEGFWRKGNVEIVCTRFDIPFFHTLDEAIGGLLTKFQSNDTQFS